MRKKPLPALLSAPVPLRAVLGTQWGDEGKGKVVDLLGENVDIVARYQGGANAGHTVEFDGDKFILHLIPTGILRPHIHCVLGNGMVIHPDSFLKEVAVLEKKGLEVLSRLHISPGAHLILDYHQQLEKCCEESAGDERIGTTGRGIGPAYADKASRVGIRVGDLFHERILKTRVRENTVIKNRWFKSVYQQNEVSEQSILNALQSFRDRIGPCVDDTTWFLHQSLQSGKNILIESAQGTLLDIDFGTYPFVTSSNTTLGGMATGLGFGIRKLNQVVGVVKAYTTRVGNGPFPTELIDDTGERLRKTGEEYGATTGRPRRCGWFDALVARYSVMLNGIDSLAVTKMDVLDDLDEIPVCIAYRIHGREVTRFPADVNLLPDVEPVYEILPGWKRSLLGITKWNQLPHPARRYLKRIEELTGATIGLVSVGPSRKATIWVE
ncbi:MAG TPA: adenylosuccinate synthase [bacterium]|nr:adenylosuccinate synthase [bacterium]